VQVVPVEDVPGLEAFHAVEVACRAHDHVGLPADPLEELLPLLDPSLPAAGEKRLLRVAFDGTDVVGAADLSIPTLDNLSSASVTVFVPPPLRGAGIGRRILDALLAETAALARPRLFFEAPSPYPTGRGIADSLLASAGARPVLKEVRRLLDLRAVDIPPPPAPPGYRFVPWVDRVPEEHLDGMAHLMHRMSVDVPLGDMDWEPEVWDGKRYRDKEESAMGRGRTRYAVLAVHESSGEAVAFTDIGVSRFAPETAYQWETIVTTDHRGHGLGFALKAHNHRALATGSPQTRWVNTWNAESNTHMVAINERLGFSPMDYWTEWQLDR
jgi:GNAT superfamily N-acetyltransferase